MQMNPLRDISSFVPLNRASRESESSLAKNGVKSKLWSRGMFKKSRIVISLLTHVILSDAWKVHKLLDVMFFQDRLSSNTGAF